MTSRRIFPSTSGPFRYDPPRLCGPEGYCNSKAVGGAPIVRCPWCQACENAYHFWNRVFEATVDPRDVN